MRVLGPRALGRGIPGGLDVGQVAVAGLLGHSHGDERQQRRRDDVQGDPGRAAVSSATAQGAQTLKSASGCALNITGGTETGHPGGTYSHWNGYKLDYSKYTCIGNYIKNTFTYIGVRGDGAPQWKSGSGNIYADEGNHWDVTYYNCGGC
ncbi:hypothetical protein SGLAM104S_09385 [Streptomyces glaucescens]